MLLETLASCKNVIIKFLPSLIWNVPIVGNSSVSLSLSKNEKVEHHIRMKTHKPIALMFWVKSGVNPLYVGWAYVSLVLYLPDDLLSKDPTMVSKTSLCGDRLR